MFFSFIISQVRPAFTRFCHLVALPAERLPTAALQGDSAFQWRVRLGSSFASTGGATHSVSRLVLHRNYNNRELTNDIAIVKLTSNAVLSANIGLARIAGPNYHLADGTLVYAAGWGATSSGGMSSEVLLRVGLNIINHQLCTERYAYLKTQPNFEDWPDVTPEMLCAGILNVGGKDTCQGDSGGPLVHQTDALVGITSWGYRCADPFYPGVSVRVSSYTSWISENA
ncbi:unnamed protein product, partial [Brenthis ino]